MESSTALRPSTVVEIKWSDRYVDRPENLKELFKFANQNKLPFVWNTTRKSIQKQYINGVEVRQWSAAALAFHYEVCAIQGYPTDFDVKIKSRSECHDVGH